MLPLSNQSTGEWRVAMIPAGLLLARRAIEHLTTGANDGGLF